MTDQPNQPAKRKVNPMLLLGTESQKAKKKPDTAPALIETGNFKSDVRRSFPSVEENETSSDVKKNNGSPLDESPRVNVRPPVKASRTPVSGVNPFRNTGNVEQSDTDVIVEPKGALLAEDNEETKVSPHVNKRDEKPRLAREDDDTVSSTPTPTAAHSGARKVNPMFADAAPVSKPAAARKPAGDTPRKVNPVFADAAPAPKIPVTPPVVKPAAGLPVTPPAAPKANDAPRKVNPMFLAGEEKEHTDVEAAKRGGERILRPSFILPGEKAPLSRLPKPADSGKRPFQALPEGEAKPRAQYARKIDANVEAEDWNEDTSSDTGYGLGGEADEDYIAPQYSKAFHLTERDILMMRFLARYRYAYTDQLARLVDSMPKTIIPRLRVLEKRGFIRKQPITDRQYLWVTRKAGNLLVDINFPEIRKGSLSYATIAHTIGIANLGVELEREAGGKDLLGEGKGMDEWQMPMNRYKFGIWGNPEGKTLGEMTVTEREVRQGQLRWRGGRSSKEMRDLVSLAAANREPVELEEGQEGLFVVYGQGGKGGEHIPDLVVARERDEDGKPQHIAIELELTPKTPADWKKILRNYRDNGEMYSKVYYFTHKRSISTGILKADEEVGLGDRLKVRKYVPINSNIPFWG